jgi:lysozyme
LQNVDFSDTNDDFRGTGDTMATALDLFRTLAQNAEGYYHKAYKDPAKGIWTIGIGHCGSEVVPGLVWTDAQIEAAFAKDAAEAIRMTLHYSPSVQHQSVGTQAAIYDFVFNEGIGRYMESTFKKDIDRGDLVAAKKSILMWNKGTVNGQKVVLPGLVTRRQAEADLIGT